MTTLHLLFSLSGLILGMYGVWLLSRGEFSTTAARFNYWASGESQRMLNKELQKIAWLDGSLIRLAQALGSKRAVDMVEESAVKAFGIKLRGFFMIFSGFLIQAVGSLVAWWSTSWA